MCNAGSGHQGELPAGPFHVTLAPGQTAMGQTANQTGTSSRWGDGGTRGLSLSLKDSGAHSMVAPGEYSRRFPVVGLKEVFDMIPEQRIDLLKLECEGAEYEILMTLSKADLAKIRFLGVDVHATDHF